MTELKTEVDDCKKIIKFLETEIGCKNVIINKLLENKTQLIVLFKVILVSMSYTFR
jgi:hypothetical protein